MIETSDPSERGEQIVIANTTQATLGDVNIGAGNFWEREYTDPQGETRKGMSAALAIYVEDDPDSEQTVIAHPGKEFTAGGMRFRVEAVDDDRVTIVTLHQP